MTAAFALGIASAAMAIGSAIFWWRSAARSIPPLETYWDQMPDDAPFLVAMKKTSADNRTAAALSGLAAIFGALSIAIQTWPS